MKIYIATSWKNEHAVAMLTSLLREKGHEVMSFVENNYGAGHGAEKPFNFDDWVKTPQANDAFRFDTSGATQSDLVIYISPAGTDAWAEVGAAWASGVPIIGLYAKGEQAGLMRLMVQWAFSVPDLLDAIDELQSAGHYEGLTHDLP